MKRRRGAAHTSRGRTSVGTASDAASNAARRRVEGVLERLARVELQVVVVAPPDATRSAARDRARAAASVAGRSALMHEAMAAARDMTMRSFARSSFSGTWAATDMAMSVVSASDRVAAAEALEEAAMAAVVEDLVDEETLEVLRSTWEELSDMSGMPAPGSLSGFASPAAAAIRGPIQVAIGAIFVVVCGTLGAALGLAAGLIPLAIGTAMLTGLIWRRSHAEG